MPPRLVSITGWPIAGFDTLAAEAGGEGYCFLDKLESEWLDGINTFSGDGEKLLGALSGDALIAIGGIQRDPYRGADRIGRLRRVYVSPSWRRQGIARTLVRDLLRDGRRNFDLVRLRVPDADAARFYEAIGFAVVGEPDATHVLRWE